MIKSELLKDLMAFQINKYHYKVVGNRLYFTLNENNYAVAELINPFKKNNYDGVKITCISKRYGHVDTCDLMFIDIFEEKNSQNLTICMDDNGDGFKWYQEPSDIDKFNFSDHIDRYFEIIASMNVAPLMASDFPFIGTAFRTEIGSFGARQDVIESHQTYLEAPSYSETINTSEVKTKEKSTMLLTTSSENLNNIQTLEIESEVIPNTSDNVIDIQVDEDIEGNNNEQEENVLTYETISDEILEESADAENTEVETKEDPQVKPRSKSLLDRFFHKKEKSVEKTEQKNKTVVDLFSDEENESINDGIEEESFFASWEIGLKNKKDIIATLKKKTEDYDYYELHILGKGRMCNYSHDLNKAPWHEYASKIQSVIIYDGVTNVGNFAFKSCNGLKTVKLFDSIKMIGDSAFEYCHELESIRFPKKLEIIGDFAFAGCEKLLSIKLPEKVREIGDYAFEFDNGEEGLVIQCLDPEQIKLGDGLVKENFIKFKKISTM